MKSGQSKTSINLRKSGGFSLIELLIVIFIVMILASVLSVLYFNAVNTQKNILTEASSLTDARTALYIMEKEVREASLFINADSYQITFIKKDADKKIYKEIFYYVEKTDNNNYMLIKKQEDESEKIILRNLVSDKIFSFFYKAGNEPIKLPMEKSDLNNFKILKISLTINNNLKDNDKNLSLSSSVYLRNR